MKYDRLYCFMNKTDYDYDILGAKIATFFIKHIFEPLELFLIGSDFNPSMDK